MYFTPHERRIVAQLARSAIPTSIGVNPQLTIMALASRAADHIDEFLSEC